MQQASAPIAPTTSASRAAVLIPCQEVPRFVESAPVVVLYVDPAPPPTPLVLDVFALHPSAAVARVDPSTHQPSWELAFWLASQPRALGLSGASMLPRGYHLFIDGIARAHSTGGVVLPALIIDGAWSLLCAAGEVAAWGGSSTPWRAVRTSAPRVVDYTAAIDVARTFARMLPTRAERATMVALIRGRS